MQEEMPVIVSSDHSCVRQDEPRRCNSPRSAFDRGLH